MRDHIFISYRRDDARGASGRLCDWLRIAFGPERVFRDVASIGVGKWRDRIDAALACSAVCLAVIGPRWADATNLPRLHDEADMVRHELAAALAGADQGRVIPVPVLVEAAVLPAAGGLPAVLRPLVADWNARTLSEEGWGDDMRRLVAELAEATGSAVAGDLDTLLRDASAAAEQLAAQQRQLHLQGGQIDAQRRTIDELTRQLAEAGSAAQRSELAAAFTALARGDTLAAEHAFEREFEAQAEQAKQADAARRAMAEAALNVANLALLHDVGKAVAFYRKALLAQPDDARVARLLGEALLVLGDTEAAAAALQASLTLARRQGLALGETQAARADAGGGGSRDLSVSLDRIGDVLAAQGDADGALAAYQRALATAEALVQSDPGNTGWRRDLGVSHEKLGDVLAARDDPAGALAAYRRSLALREALVAAHDPPHTAWQRDVSVSHNRIGDVLCTLTDLEGALAAYRQGLAIAEALAARDAANAVWQRDLSISRNRIGDALALLGDAAGALASYRRGLQLTEVLAARDPANVPWQCDLAVSCAKLGTQASLAESERRRHLERGRGILAELDAAGRLPPNLDRLAWFAQRLRELDAPPA